MSTSDEVIILDDDEDSAPLHQRQPSRFNTQSVSCLLRPGAQIDLRDLGKVCVPNPLIVNEPVFNLLPHATTSPNKCKFCYFQYKYVSVFPMLIIYKMRCRGVVQPHRWFSDETDPGQNIMEMLAMLLRCFFRGKIGENDVDTTNCCKFSTFE